MTFQVGAQLSYTAVEPGTFILNIHAQHGAQKILQEYFFVEPYHFFDELLTSPENNRLVRISTTKPTDINFSYSAIVENSFRIVNCENYPGTPLSQLDPSVLTYLHPSRYCQSDKLYRLAGHQFGKIDNPFLQVVQITEWIHSNVEYLSGSTNAETSAYDTVTQQAGVCRDFAHLGIALCRALNIPARYCSVYAYQLQPQDFHACFEAYLSGQWIIFDATKLAPLNGFVKIAVGRDAADAAIANLFGNILGNYIEVTSQLTNDDFRPFFYSTDSFDGIAYD